MAKKRYCQKCQNLIEEGKEIKFSRRINYYSSRSSSGPQGYATYYLCPKCYQQQQEEIQTKNKQVWQQVGWSLLICLIILILFAVFLIIYQYRWDKQVDRITKKVQKK